MPGFLAQNDSRYVRDDSRYTQNGMRMRFFSVLLSLAGCAIFGDDVATNTHQVGHNSPGDRDSRGANARSDERRAEAENS